MLGGYQILDLRNIDLTLGGTASNISDAEVLKQLRALRNLIQKDYNFARPLNNQLKPVLIRFRDKKTNEKHEGAVYGLLEVLTNYYNFRINAKIDNENLTINVEFEEKTDEYSNKYWDIKTAKVLLTNNQIIEGDLDVGGDIEIEGDASIGGDLEVTGVFEADNISGNSIIENMEGYEASISESDENTTLAPIYCGVVKNGNKLTIVYVGRITKIGTSDTKVLALMYMPSAVLDKLYPNIIGLYNVLDVKNVDAFSDPYSSVNVVSFTDKQTSAIRIYIDTSNLVQDTQYFYRYEVTFLLSENLIPQP